MLPGTFRLLVGIAGFLGIASCDEPVADRSLDKRVAAADVPRGAALVGQYGCAACHEIPGVRAFGGAVGPSLVGLSSRAYIAGGLPNRPDTVAHFIVNAPLLSPDTAMPNMRVTLEEARDIAAYLYALPGRS